MAARSKNTALGLTQGFLRSSDSAQRLQIVLKGRMEDEQLREVQIAWKIRQKPPVAAGPAMEVAHWLVSGVEILRERAVGGKTRIAVGKIPQKAGIGGINIGIYIYDQAEVLHFSGPFEVFSTASRLCSDEKPFTVFRIGETGGVVTARAGYRVIPAYGMYDHPPIGVLIVAGGVHDAEMYKADVIAWIAKEAKTAKIVAPVCTGAFLLAEAGAGW